MRELVKLRKKKLADGGYSLYLDMCRDGKRSFEFLKLYLRPETDKESIKANKSTMEAAKMLQAQRIVDIERGKANMLVSPFRTPLLSEYTDKYLRTHNLADSTKKSFLSANKVFREANEDMRLGAIKQEHILHMIEVARETMNDTSANCYFMKLNTLFRRAVKDEIITSNPCDKLDLSQRPRARQGHREYLTLEEVRMLSNTDCKKPMLKQAFLFSCFTGLRISDIKALRWDMISKEGIRLAQHKTKEMVYIPLSDNALMWLPVKKGDMVFDLDKSERQITRDLRDWVARAGVKKHVTFHVARHTFATLLISSGADLYVVSKLLGHTNINTTQIYAKIVDESRRKAVNLIPTL